MSFRVQKSLGNSSFQFAASRRRELKSLDHDPELSTGPSGEFVRHRPEIFYSADLRTIHTPEVRPIRSIAGTPFWTSLYDGTARGWAMLGFIAFGALLMLIGFGVVLGKGKSAGWVEVIFGLILVAIPFLVTGQKRRAVRLQEAKVRKEREEREQRDRELLAAYTTSLEKLRDDPSPAALELVRRENEKLDMPYAVWADTAIGTVLYVGFSTLAKVGPSRATEVAALMDQSSDAAGLIAEDAQAVKNALYSTILWHFLADDRLGEEQVRIVRSIQQGFGIAPQNVPIDTSSEAQFDRLRGIDHRNAPRCDAQMPLGMNEYCMYTAQIRQGGSEAATPIYVTNRRLLVGADKQRIEVQVPKIDDVTVDADSGRIIIRAAELKRPLDIRTEEPIYLAALIDLASRLDDRPKSFT